MPEIKKVIFPVDFSDRSAGAAHYVEAIAAKFDPQIVMLHVLPPPHYEAMSLEISGPALAEIMQSRETAAKTQIKKFLAEELAGFRVDRQVVDGDPAAKIVETATQTKADLIVMTTHGYGRFRRFILGSVTSKVLHDTACPVLTGVHLESAPEKIDIKKIVVAIDLDTHSSRILQWGTELAKKFAAKLIVVHVASSIEGHTGEYFDTDWRETFAKPVRERIQTQLQATNAEATVIVDYGDPSKQVCEVAEAEKANLMVIGRGHSEGIFGRLRTHSYAIIRMAPCPVVSV